MVKKIDAEIEAVVLWLQDMTAAAGARGLVVGISGGIDSAVVACLIKKAFPDNSVGVVMPCSSSSIDKEYAEKLIAACGIAALEMDLTNIHSQLFGDVAERVAQFAAAKEHSRLANANLKARLRMSTLYAVANHLNYLVVGTDNAPETYTGYFTKYGDGGVDLIPLANLTKRQVREWARHLGVPEEIIHRAPTAGLWENQTDEGEMGTTYEMIDDFLEGKPIPQRDRQIIERLHRVSEHKRNLPAKPGD